MDAARHNKAFLKSRMREAAQKREKRIESPLVRYNDLGQPVCKVCNIAVKSESLWPAHLTSRQHKEAADKLKAQSKGVVSTSGNSSSANNVDATKTKPRVSSSLPDDFWDQPDAKRAATTDIVARHDNVVLMPEEKKGAGKTSEQPPVAVRLEPAKVMKIKSSMPEEKKGAGKTAEQPPVAVRLEPTKVMKIKSEDRVAQPPQDGLVAGKSGQQSLPEGFFDNVDADYRARGLEPPKYDIQDELKEFQKVIRDDIQEVDLRMEEEEVDAAEDREKIENLHQRELLDRLEKVRRKEQEQGESTEITEVITRVASRKPFVNINLSMDEESDRDDESEDDENALLDWRAKKF